MPASMLPGSIATRQAASQGFIDEGGFGGIPLQIGQFGFRGSNFAVERRVESHPSGKGAVERKPALKYVLSSVERESR